MKKNRNINFFINKIIIRQLECNFKGRKIIKFRFQFISVNFLTS